MGTCQSAVYGFLWIEDFIYLLYLSLSLSLSFVSGRRSKQGLDRAVHVKSGASK